MYIQESSIQGMVVCIVHFIVMNILNLGGGGLSMGSCTHMDSNLDEDPPPQAGDNALLGLNDHVDPNHTPQLCSLLNL